MKESRERQSIRPRAGVLIVVLAFQGACAPDRSDPHEDVAQAVSAAGRTTVLCGYGAPLAPGFSGSSPPGPCEGVCSTSGGNAFCSDPGDSGSRLDVYGCAGK